MIAIGAFGCPFDHDLGSCFGRPPTSHFWQYNSTPDSGLVVYMDLDFLGGLHSDARFKYLWLCESRAITPKQHEFSRNHQQLLSGSYRMVFTHDYSLIDSGPPFVYVPPAANHTWIRNPQLYRKSKLVSMISSGKSFSEGHMIRNELTSTIAKRFPYVDFFGRQHRPFESKEDVLCDYMFSVAIENDRYDDYYTEKLMDCFATTTIPIYRGSSKVFDTFDPRGVIFLDDFNDFDRLTHDLYQTMLPFALKNLELLNHHMTADDILFELISLDLAKEGLNIKNLTNIKNR